MIEISVIIPTYNRCATLLRCLAALGKQTLDRSRFEILVVDDGSTDKTATALINRSDLRYFQQPRNAGPAAARNVGIHAARGTYVLFLGDDTIARPRLLEQHLAAHAAHPGDQVAVLGYAPWSAEGEITPLMRYLFTGQAFQQFRYHAIADPDNVPFGFFYTCNLSISRQFLLRHGLFDEEFRRAYGEDTELAYRLQQHGLRIVFRRALVADHEHPTSYRSACRRARSAGAVAVLMARKHPALADLGFVAGYGAKTRALIAVKRGIVAALIDPLLDLADRRRWDHPLLARSYDWAIRKHQLFGLLDALKQGSDRPGGAQTLERKELPRADLASHP
jgi:GT2 family glycosyltransferase